MADIFKQNRLAPERQIKVRFDWSKSLNFKVNFWREMLCARWREKRRKNLPSRGKGKNDIFITQILTWWINFHIFHLFFLIPTESFCVKITWELCRFTLNNRTLDLPVQFSWKWLQNLGESGTDFWGDMCWWKCVCFGSVTSVFCHKSMLSTGTILYIHIHWHFLYVI